MEIEENIRPGIAGRCPGSAEEIYHVGLERDEGKTKSFDEDVSPGVPDVTVAAGNQKGEFLDICA